MYEVESIRRLVKDIDTRFDCRWESDSEEYVITQTSPLGQVSWYGSIRYDELNSAFFDDMRRNVYINTNGDVLSEVMEQQIAAEIHKDKAIDDEISDVVKETGHYIYNKIKEA